MIIKETKTILAKLKITIPGPARAFPLISLMIQSYKNPLTKVLLDLLSAKDNIVRLFLKPIAKDNTTDYITLFCNYTLKSLLPPLSKMASLLLI